MDLNLDHLVDCYHAAAADYAPAIQRFKVLISFPPRVRARQPQSGNWWRSSAKVINSTRPAQIRCPIGAYHSRETDAPLVIERK